MGFEAPLALLALAAAGLPVLAHLLRRQDLPRRALATIALLRRAEATSRRRVRLVDLLLLIVRVLLIAAAAFAIAKPFVRVDLAYGDGSIASVAIVVDDSMSTSGRPALWDAARARAREIVESLPAGSEVALVLAGSPARVVTPRTEDVDAALRALASVRAPSARGTDLSAALERAERELAGARHADRRIVVLSDLAAHGEAVELSSVRSIATSFEQLGDVASTRNAAIVAARAMPDPTTPSMSSIAIEIRASNHLAGEVLPVVLRRGDEELARGRAEIASGGARVTLHAPVSVDDPSVTVTIEVDDAIDADDVRGVLLRPPAGARVLVVDGDPHPVGDDDEARFVSAAIDLAPVEGGALSRRTVDADTFAAMDLTDVEVVVLANVTTPSARVLERLRDFVAHGGGLLFAPGDHFESRSVIARFSDLLPAHPRVAADVEVEGPFPAPGSALLSADEGLRRARTRRRLAFEDASPDAEVALTFGDGSPALLLGRHGDGRVALLATTLDDDWTDLPYHPGFLPLVVSLLRELAPTTSMPDTPLPAGPPVSLGVPAGAVRVHVSTPDGRGLDFTGDELAAGVVVTDTEEPGVYRVQVASRDHALREETRMAFLVAAPPEESDLTPGRVPESSGPSERAAASSVVTRPIAPWLFLLVGLLALLEAGLRLRSGHLGRAKPRPAVAA